MRSDDALENRGGQATALKAAVAGIAALCAAALAVAGAADGAPPPGSAPGRAAPGPQAGPAAAGGGSGPAAALPLARRLCFHGPRGEAVDFPAVLDCP